MDTSRPRHGGRALLETAALIVGGTVWYWRNLDFNSRDWDLRWNGDSWGQKLAMQAFRFDQNLFDTNTFRHAGAGVGHYHIVRGNGFGVVASVVATLATSLFWEYVVEFREYPSLNDVLTNTVAGFTVGEPLYRLGELLLEGGRSWAARGAAWLVSPVATLNDTVDKRQRQRGARFLERPRFRARTAWTHRSVERGSRQVSLDGVGLETELDLVSIPGYGRTGRLGAWVAPGEWVAFNVRGEAGRAGLLGLGVESRVLLLGRYRQSLARTPGRRLTGHSALLGLGSALEYEQLAQPGGRDYAAILDVAGPVLHLGLHGRGLALRWQNELYGSFAMVNALAFGGRVTPIGDGVFRPGLHGGRIPGVVGARGYYYGLGYSGRTRLELGSGRWNVGGELRSDRFRSIRGWDRFREEIGAEYHIVDRKAVARVWLGFDPWATGLQLWSGLSWRRRQGQAEELVAAYLDRRLDLGLSIMF